LPILNTILEERKLETPVLYAISSRGLFPGISVPEYLRALFESPAGMVQWREKDLSREENRHFVRMGVNLASETGKLFLVNADFRLALQERAHGAHLTSAQHLESGIRLRERLGFQKFLLGKSTHSVQEVICAAGEGADYVFLSPIFKPISKASSLPALGLKGLRKAVESVSIPVFALGGMTEKNASQAFNSGALGVAGISWASGYIRECLARRAESHPPR